MQPFDTTEATAQDLDAQDPLAPFRDLFVQPGEDEDLIYFGGQSLGLMPRAARTEVHRQLDRWSSLAVEANYRGDTPWASYADELRAPCARLLGAQPHEVVLMNGLTVNLHLLLTTFYQPTPKRYEILVEDGAFASDLYALASHLRRHGFASEQALVRWTPRPGEHTLHTSDLEDLLNRRGDRIALVLLGGVHHLTGQALDLARITAAAHSAGCTVGFDLAHSIGNMPHELHEWSVDFAVWCGYKYLNGGPGALAGAFVHQRHSLNPHLPRLAGWWGVDPERRFQPTGGCDFHPQSGAAGWQLSYPPILALAPLRESLALFEEAGLDSLRRKSIRLTGYLEFLVKEIGGDRLVVITPECPESRGCQLSIQVQGDGAKWLAFLRAQGVLVDLRRGNILRVVPVPFYNSFHEVWRFHRMLAEGLRMSR